MANNKKELVDAATSKKASSKKTATKKITTEVAAVKHAKKNKDASSLTSSVQSPFSMTFPRLILAVVCLVLGLLTPPLFLADSKTLMAEASVSRKEERTTATGRNRRTTTATTSDQQREQQQQEVILNVQGEPSQDLSSGRIDDPCSVEQLENFWHDRYVHGFHIVCLEMDGDDYDNDENVGVDDEQDTSIRMRLFRGGLPKPERKVTLIEPVNWQRFANTLQAATGMKPMHDLKQPWALFSSVGERLATEDDPDDDGALVRRLAREYGLLLVYEGGQFLWPGVRIGFTRDIDIYSIMPINTTTNQEKRTVTLETLSLVPLVVSVQGFLSPEECEHIQAKASPHMQYSGVVLMDKDQGRPASDFRTSQSTFLVANDQIMKDIDDRTASLVRVPRNHQETVQVLRYGHGERYVSHTDYFEPSLYEQDPSTLSMIANGRRNRLATVFWYLSTVPEGGETVFPRFEGGVERSFEDCETGLKVKPEAGKVIIFYSLTHGGARDPNSLHGACPVKEGVKWAANKWVWNERMYYVQ